jgi:hypothetical protein
MKSSWIFWQIGVKVPLGAGANPTKFGVNQPIFVRSRNNNITKMIPQKQFKLPQMSNFFAKLGRSIPRGRGQSYTTFVEV